MGLYLVQKHKIESNRLLPFTYLFIYCKVQKMTLKTKGKWVYSAVVKKHLTSFADMFSVRKDLKISCPLDKSIFVIPQWQNKCKM